MGSFASSIKANIERVKRETQQKAYNIVYEAFNSVVYLTPVKTGLLKNNWFTMPNATFSNATTSIEDKSGGGSLLNIQSLAQNDMFYGRDSFCTMANNLSYAVNAEYLGWARTPPYGMVRISLRNVGAKYQ